MRYAQALRKTGQRAQAVAILEKASIESPHNKAVLGAYGRALADAGNYDQALQVLDRAHTPDQPDWHILSAQGAVLDQMGRHSEAQRYYLTALKIAPDEPSVLSNLGLSYALSKNLAEAEDDAAPRRYRVRRSIRGCGRTSRLWSACKAASPRPRTLPAPTCRPTRPPKTRQCRLSAADAGASQRPARSRATPPTPTPARADGPTLLYLGRAIVRSITLIVAGPRITMNSTGRKNRIIGTVSLAAGRPPSSRPRPGAARGFPWPSPAARAERRAVALGLDHGGHRLDAGVVGALGEALVGQAALGQIGELGGQQRQLLGQLDRGAPTSWPTFCIAASIDMPDSTQISSRSSASGNAGTIDWRRLIATFEIKIGRVAAEIGRRRRCKLIRAGRQVDTTKR